MRKVLRTFLPSRHDVLSNRWLKPLAGWLDQPNLWDINRRSVAGGVAAGLLCGLIPGPVQMLGGALLSILFRVNLPVALFATLYTNPLTIVPLYVLAYEYGALVTGQHPGLLAEQLALPEIHWHNWFEVVPAWLTTLGKPFLVGLPLLAVTLAVTGYVAVRLVWRWRVIHAWQRRHRHGEWNND